MLFFKVFSCDSTRRLNPRSTNCEVDALTTTLYKEKEVTFDIHFDFVPFEFYRLILIGWIDNSAGKVLAVRL